MITVKMSLIVSCFRNLAAYSSKKYFWGVLLDFELGKEAYCRWYLILFTEVVRFMVLGKFMVLL